ncbi:MAG TPA: hypothetical protein VNM16_08820 [Bacillota bacterium]|nr:hypothetical protein [Bacillota bacterium]
MSQMPQVPAPWAGARVQHAVPQFANQHFEPLPAPTGAPPYRLALANVLGADAVAGIQAAGTLAFHVLGDTGGVKFPVPQRIVAMHMAADCDANGIPAFCYHVGDVVYYNGSNSEFYSQFYEPYADYPRPILAIP